MPCLIAFGGLTLPRVAIIVIALVSDYIGTAFDSVLWPILGFFFMPTTTLAYAWAWHTRAGHHVAGVHLAIVILAALLDLGIIGSGRSWFVGRRRA